MADQIRDHFRVERVLKQSEWGTVSLVWDQRTKTRRIYRDFVGNGEAYRRMLGVDCPFLPGVEAVEEADGHVLVLEEYIQGDTLAEILACGPLLPEQTGRIAIQLCRGLEALHAVGIVHRDVKPENVILRGEEAVLIDFDVSRLNKEEQDTDTHMMGTAGYAAPEQYGFAQSDARADIYALGVLLNEMLVRQHPAKQLAEGVYLPVISKCIEVNVDRRFSSARELLGALERVIPVRKERKKRGRPTRWIALAAAVCVLAGGIIYAFFREKALSKEPSVELVWVGENRTGFRYDPDGDGEKEDYVFGIVVDADLPDQHITNEYIGIRETDSPNRNPYPCVWRYGEDGSLQAAGEFKQLLEDVTLTIRCETDPEAKPVIVPQPGGWPGALRIFFPAGLCGTWVYEAGAVLDGTTLTASAITTTYRLQAGS